MRHTTRFMPLLLCGFLAGCATTSTKNKNEPPPVWQEARPSLPAKPRTTAQQTNTPAVSVKSTPETQPVWQPVETWVRRNGGGSLRVLASHPQISYSLTLTNGVFAFQIGSRTAYWDGMQIRLGFSPMMASNTPHLHSLDLQKNLEPLMQSLTLPSPGRRTVVLDPGHGGGNTGTRSVVDGRFEKELTLDWAQRLAPLLRQRGWQVWLTHTNDVDLSLPDRVDFATQHHADLFISLHFNSSGGSGEAAGVETFCLTPAGMPSTLLRDYPDDVEQVYPNNAFDTPNLQYAARLHRALLNIRDQTDRGVCRARFPGILRNQQQPAVLIEGGFLSSPDEARRIGDPAFRQLLAQAVADALSNEAPENQTAQHSSQGAP